jgi:putative ABC transport system permease protein
VSLSSLRSRAPSAAVVVVGVAGVVGVLISILAISGGLEATLEDAGSPSRAIVLRNTARTEAVSNIELGWVSLIADAPGVRRGQGSRASISPELLISANLPKRDGTLGAVLIRGIDSVAAAEVRPEWTLIAGRKFRSGLREIVVGRAAAAEFRDLSVGATVVIGTNAWTVVGIFSSNGDAHESSVLADVKTLMSSVDRGEYSSVTVRLSHPSDFEVFRAALTSNPTMSVDVIRETDYYRQQSELVARLLFLVSNLVGVIMAIGAGFTALNTMYSSVRSRTQEIATFRAIGFGAGSVAISVLVESLVLSIAGAAVGVVVAWTAFNGNVISTLGGGMDSQIVFKLHIGLGLALQGVIWSCAIGLLGGILPALRAARLPVSKALRPD